MNRTRIEIATTPQELPAPHFDDEATIVSARQVVPIARAKVVERSRALLSVIPVLIGAAVFGALGAMAVNYYERNALVSAPRSEINQQTNQPPSPQTQAEIPANSSSDSAAGGLSASESPSPELESSETESQADAKGVDSPAVEPKASDNQTLPTKPANQTNDGTSTEPGKLIRKRRVHPPSPPTDGKTENPPTARRGAGRIQEIFTGPNPQ